LDHMRHPLLTILAFAAAATGVACLGKSTLATGPSGALIYAVLYGNVVTADSAFDLRITGQAYADSASAIADAKADTLGTFRIALSGTTSYFEPLYVKVPRVLYITLEGSAIVGSTEVNDTVRAIRVRFDSVGGGPHDSLEVDLPLH
jgi:hypothetical protein